MPLFGDVFLPTSTADGRTQQIDTEDDLTSFISFFSYIMSYETPLYKVLAFVNVQPVPF